MTAISPKGMIPVNRNVYRTAIHLMRSGSHDRVVPHIVIQVQYAGTSNGLNRNDMLLAAIRVAGDTVGECPLVYELLIISVFCLHFAA